MRYEGDDDTNFKWCAWNSLRMLGNRIGKVGNQRIHRDYQYHSSVEIDQNNAKRPGDLTGLAVSRTVVKNYP